MTAMDQLALLERIAAMEGAALGEGNFGPGPAVWVGKREIAHFDDDDVIDLRLTKGVIRERKDELKNDSRVARRNNASDWIEVTIAGPDDEAFVLALAREAIAANALTAKPGLPPTGAELERRRRFH